MTVPALRQLRRLFPDAHITLATRSWAEGLFEDAEFLDDLMVHEGSGLRSVVHQVREWRRRSFDLAVLLPNSLETALVASLARVPLRIGYATDGRQRLLTHPLDLPDSRSSQHEVFYYLNIIARLEWLVNREQSFLNTQPDASLEVAEPRKVAAMDLLLANGKGHLGITDGRPLIALCPGSINSRAKRWPAERYAALADRFIDECGADVLLIGSAAEEEVSLEVSERMHNNPVMLHGQDRTRGTRRCFESGRSARDQRHWACAYSRRSWPADPGNLRANQSPDDAAIFALRRDCAPSSRLCALHAARLPDRSSLHDGNQS